MGNGVLSVLKMAPAAKKLVFLVILPILFAVLVLRVVQVDVVTELHLMNLSTPRARVFVVRANFVSMEIPAAGVHAVAQVLPAATISVAVGNAKMAFVIPPVPRSASLVI